MVRQNEAEILSASFALEIEVEVEVELHRIGVLSDLFDLPAFRFDVAFQQVLGEEIASPYCWSCAPSSLGEKYRRFAETRGIK